MELPPDKITNSKSEPKISMVTEPIHQLLPYLPLVYLIKWLLLLHQLLVLTLKYNGLLLQLISLLLQPIKLRFKTVPQLILRI